MGVQVGEGNTQIIYTYNRLTWTDGVAPPPLVSVSGAVEQVAAAARRASAEGTLRDRDPGPGAVVADDTRIGDDT
jgi:hypothetical protein